MLNYTYPFQGSQSFPGLAQNYKAHNMNNKKYHCLLLEDDPEDQEMFINAIHEVSENTACYAVTNGIEALQVLEEAEFIPDFIFTDINMPLMDGFEFLKTIKASKAFRQLPVIIYSSDYSNETINKAKMMGASAIFSKSRPGVLKQILSKYLLLESAPSFDFREHLISGKQNNN